jgi:hypothetical protein
MMWADTRAAVRHLQQREGLRVELARVGAKHPEHATRPADLRTKLRHRISLDVIKGLPRAVATCALALEPVEADELLGGAALERRAIRRLADPRDRTPDERACSLPLGRALDQRPGCATRLEDRRR